MALGDSGMLLVEVFVLRRRMLLWRMCRHVEALKLGYPAEHDGHRQAVNFLRSSKRLRKYVMTNTETGAETVITDAAAFELQHKLPRCGVSHAANPNSRARFVTLHGVKHTVTYDDSV